MKYQTLTQSAFTALAQLYVDDYNAFKSEVLSIIEVTIERNKLLFDEFPDEFKGITNAINIQDHIDIDEVQKIIQKIANVQFIINAKEESLNKPQEQVINNLNPKKMKTSKNNSKANDFKNKAVKATDLAASGVFGVLHFTFQSLADITLEAEGSVRSKLTSVEKKEIIRERQNKTIQKQIKCIEANLRMRASINDAVKKLGDLTETKSVSNTTVKA